jgi:hypothetical protein
LIRFLAPGALACFVCGLSGCQEQLPTTTEGEYVPVTATTVEVRLPFDEFARDLRIVGGYGQAYELGHSIVARDYQGTLDSRTLVRFWPYPTVASV